MIETHVNNFATLTTTIFLHLPVWLQFLLVFTFHAYPCTLFWYPYKKIYYVTCFRVMVYCNKCLLSIFTQVFVSYFCFLTSESCTISCWRTNHIHMIIILYIVWTFQFRIYKCCISSHIIICIDEVTNIILGNLLQLHSTITKFSTYTVK